MTSEHFARLKLLLGEEGLEALAESTVMVVGFEGVGLSCAETLTRGSVGNLILIDGDVVEPSSLSRQALAFVSTIGRVKAEVMGAVVTDINLDCTTYVRQIFLTRGNLTETLEQLPRPDYIIDAIDDVTGKIGIAQWYAENHVHLISAMSDGNKLDPARLTFSKINRTKVCPLAKVVRRVYIRQCIRGLEVLYSSEESARIADKGGSAKAETLGTVNYIPPIMGQMLAGRVIHRLLGSEETPLTPRISGLADENQPPTEK